MKKQVVIIGIIGIYCFMLRNMFFVVLPFLLSLLVYFLLKPAIQKIKSYFPVKTKIIGIILLIFIYLLLLICISFLVNYIFVFVFQKVQNFPQVYENTLVPLMQEIALFFKQKYPTFFQENLLVSLYQNSGQIIMTVMTLFSKMMSQIPQVIFSFFLFLLSSLFLMIDYDDIRDKIIEICPKSCVHFLFFIKENCIKSIVIYIRCQMILMCVSFGILFFGLFILKTNHAFIIAFFTSLLDSLPFIGVGIVMIPMMLYNILLGSYLKAFYLLLLYMLINVLRSLLEPHIMNKQMKIPSFLLLLSMIIHLYFFGFIGVILSPIHMNILYSALDYYK